MSAPTPFDELTPEELQELEEREWTPVQITAAIVLALQDGNMPAVAELLRRLALVDPLRAELLLLTIQVTAAAGPEDG